VPNGLEARTLTIEDAFEVLDKLANDRLGRLVLVGGQAAAFWIARYDIADPKVVTTKDIDVFLSEAEPSIVLECAKDLGGSLMLVKEPRVPDVARVRLEMNGAELQIDFLRSLHRISASEVIDNKVLVKERGKDLFVIHPVFMLASRLFNTFELRGRLTDENLERLRLSIRAVRAYLIEGLASGETSPAADVLPSIEKIFDLAIGRPGIQAWQDHDIDVFSAVPNDSELLNCPQPFLEKRRPQMLLDLVRKRKKRTRAKVKER
jgi:hypothetical protein